MTIPDANKKTLTFRFDKPKDEIKNQLLKLKGKPSITDDIIEINLKPSIFDAFAASGLLIFTLTSYDIDKTEIICQIIPTTSSPDRLYFVPFLLFLWTMVAFALSFSLDTLILVIISWTILLSILRLSITLNKEKIENQAKFILEQLE